MFYTVFDFGALCVVEAVKGSYKISGDSADSFKVCRSKVIFNVDIVAVEPKIHFFDLPALVNALRAAYICVDFFL